LLICMSQLLTGGVVCGASVVLQPGEQPVLLVRSRQLLAMFLPAYTILRPVREFARITSGWKTSLPVSGACVGRHAAAASRGTLSHLALPALVFLPWWYGFFVGPGPTNLLIVCLVWFPCMRTTCGSRAPDFVVWVSVFHLFVVAAF